MVFFLLECRYPSLRRKWEGKARGRYPFCFCRLTFDYGSQNMCWLFGYGGGVLKTVEYNLYFLFIQKNTVVSQGPTLMFCGAAKKNRFSIYLRSVRYHMNLLRVVGLGGYGTPWWSGKVSAEGRTIQISHSVEKRVEHKCSNVNRSRCPTSRACRPSSTSSLYDWSRLVLPICTCFRIIHRLPHHLIGDRTDLVGDSCGYQPTNLPNRSNRPAATTTRTHAEAFAVLY